MLVAECHDGAVGFADPEAAAIIGVTPATLRQQIANGSLRAVKHGRDWWVTKAEVDRYLRDSRGKPGRK